MGLSRFEWCRCEVAWISREHKPASHSANAHCNFNARLPCSPAQNLTLWRRANSPLLASASRERILSPVGMIDRADWARTRAAANESPRARRTIVRVGGEWPERFASPAEFAFALSSLSLLLLLALLAEIGERQSPWLHKASFSSLDGAAR